MALLDPIVNAPTSQKAAFGVMALVVVGALGYFLVISPKRVERGDLYDKNETLRLEVTRAKAEEANLRAFRVQAEALRKRLEAAKERLPAEKEMPALYRQISNLAFQSGLSVALFQPKAIEEREVVNEVPIALTAEGIYHQFGTFFSHLAQLPRIVNVSELRLIGIDRPTGTVRAELTLATYIFRPEGAPPPAKPGTPGTPGAPPAGGAGRPGAGR